MPTTVPFSDKGVILYASQDGTGTFKDPRGNTGTARTLTASNWIASEWFYVSTPADLAVVVSGTISAAMASVLVALERQAIAPVNDTTAPPAGPLFFRPSVVSTVRGDYPAAAPKTQQTILRADLTRGAGATDAVAAVTGDTHAAQASNALLAAAEDLLDVTLLTTDHKWSGRCRVIVRASNAPAAGDKIIIAAYAG